MICVRLDRDVRFVCHAATHCSTALAYSHYDISLPDAVKIIYNAEDLLTAYGTALTAKYSADRLRAMLISTVWVLSVVN